jgi:hypothetical protein
MGTQHSDSVVPQPSGDQAPSGWGTRAFGLVEEDRQRQRQRRHENTQAFWLAYWCFEVERSYFLAGVDCVVLVPESTEVLVLERESRMVRLIEVSMKQMAE